MAPLKLCLFYLKCKVLCPPCVSMRMKTCLVDTDQGMGYPKRLSSVFLQQNGSNTSMMFLHTMLRVGDLKRSIHFYTEVLGMKLLRTTDRPEQQYTLAFLGFASNPEQAEIELTYNYGVSHYDLGNAFGHLALGVQDVYATCEQIRQLGGRITREPGPVQGGSSLIAFVVDPDGYKIELIQRKKTPLG